MLSIPDLWSRALNAVSIIHNQMAIWCCRTGVMSGNVSKLSGSSPHYAFHYTTGEVGEDWRWAVMVVVMAADGPSDDCCLVAGDSTTAQYWPEISTPGRTDGGTAGGRQCWDSGRGGNCPAVSRPVKSRQLFPCINRTTVRFPVPTSATPQMSRLSYCTEHEKLRLTIFQHFICLLQLCWCWW